MVLIESDPSSFGSVLKAFRVRAHLPQQQLASALGVHRRAIGRWESGDHLPASKSLVLELARRLRLSDQETRHLLEASLTALSPHWFVPLPRNPYFSGREEILEALHAQLGVDRAVALTQSSALHGLGGVGKTQIALEYAYRHALEYRAVFWIGAETEKQIVSSLLRVASVLQLPQRADQDQQQVVAAVQRWLSAHGQWLLIWDNVEDLGLLNRFLPLTHSGAVLITTRCQILGTLTWGITLLPMEQEQGMLFLLRRAKVVSPEGSLEQVQQMAVSRPIESAAAWELVTALGGLPLALDQAGAYLEATQCGLPAYLELFRTQSATLLKLRGEGARDHPDSVSTTFTLALRATTARHPAVLDLLRVCALLQPDTIPEELFHQAGEQLGDELSSLCGNDLAWNRVLALTCGYSLLSRQSEQQTLAMHPLVQAVLLETMTTTERERWSRRAMEALDAVFPAGEPASAFPSWKQGERLLPHALLCVQRGVRKADEALVVASLTSKAAHYLREHGRYAQAEPLAHRALHLREQVLGPRHPEVAHSLTDLGVLCWQQGKDAEAEPLLQRALHIWEQALGPQHLEIARPLNNLAIVCWQQGNYAEAEDLFHQAFHIREQVLGPDHPLVAIPLNNLADLYLEQGKEKEAEPLYQRTWHIWEQALGSEHPWVAEPLHGLANLCRGQGKEREAEPLYQRALQIREQHLGQHHPETAQLLYDLALLRKAQGRGNEALSLVERVCSIRSQALGDTHPQTVAAQRLFVQLLQEQAGEQNEAPFERGTQEGPNALRDEQQGGRTSPALSPRSCANDDPCKRSSTPAVNCIHAPGAVLLISGRPMNAGQRTTRNAIRSPEEPLSRS